MDLDDYTERTPEVTAIEGGFVRAFVGDDIPQIGHALEIRGPDDQIAYGTVRRHVGGRAIEAMLLSPPDWLAAGDRVVSMGKRAHIAGPSKGETRLEQLAFHAGSQGDSIPFELEAPSFDALDTRRLPVQTGFSAPDRLSPFCRGGLNLVLDAAPSASAFEVLVERTHSALSTPSRLWLAADGHTTLWATHQLLTGASPRRRLIGLRVLMSWAARLRDRGDELLIAAELPPLTSRESAGEVEVALGASIGEVVDQIGSALASTKSARVTTLLRLPLADSPLGIEEIIETMDVGDVDCQFFIDRRGRFDPYRSTSGADLDEEARAEQRRLFSQLHRADAARDKLAMLGEVGLDESEKGALDAAEELREQLLDT